MFKIFMCSLSNVIERCVFISCDKKEADKKLEILNQDSESSDLFFILQSIN